MNAPIHVPHRPGHRFWLCCRSGHVKWFAEDAAVPVGAPCRSGAAYCTHRLCPDCVVEGVESWRYGEDGEVVVIGENLKGRFSWLMNRTVP